MGLSRFLCIPYDSCVLISLVGYNLNNSALRSEIHGFMKLLNGVASNKPHNLYKE